MWGVVRREWSLLLALLVALALRGYQLGAQVLVGDEWHALEKAARTGYGEIAASFGRADHSIPITLFYRAAADTVGLTEPLIRAPFLLGGLATVLGVSLVARRALDRRTSEVCAWLLAVSPLLVFYSRFARPYALTCPLGLAALFLFRSHWRTGARAPAALFVLAVALGGWLSAAVLPFALAPFPFYLVRALRGAPGERRPRVRALAGLALACALALALVLLPPLLLDPEGFRSKAGWGPTRIGTILETLRVFAGTRSGALALVLLPFAAAGFVVIARRAPEGCALVCTAGALLCATIVLTGPAHAGDEFAFARYLLPLLPLLVLALSCGIARFSGRLPGTALVGPALGALLLAAGPLPATWHRPANWTANEIAFELLGKQRTIAEQILAVPAFYRELARREPGSVTLIEAPWSSPVFANALPYYQRVHRQWTRIGFTNGLLEREQELGQLPRDSGGFELRNFVFLADLLGPAGPPADYLVLHRDLRREFRVDRLPLLASLADEMHVEIAPIAERFRERFGEAEYEDELVLVFSLR